MKLKTLLIGLASGFLLTACGGPGPDEMTGEDTLGTTEGAVCEGYDSGARRCSYKCYSTSTWASFATNSVPKNGCGEAATAACGHTPNATCWSF